VTMAKSLTIVFYRLLLLPYTISERNGKNEHVIMSFIQPPTLMLCPFSSYVLVCLPPTVLQPVTSSTQHMTFIWVFGENWNFAPLRKWVWPKCY